jgi:argininosuccinate lyase
LQQLPLAEYQAIYADVDERIYAIFDFAHSVERKASIGGTAPPQVVAAVAAWRARLRTE